MASQDHPVALGHDMIVDAEAALHSSAHRDAPSPAVGGGWVGIQDIEGYMAGATPGISATITIP